MFPKKYIATFYNPQPVGNPCLNLGAFIFCLQICMISFVCAAQTTCIHKGLQCICFSKVCIHKNIYMRSSWNRLGLESSKVCAFYSKAKKNTFSSFTYDLKKQKFCFLEATIVFPCFKSISIP